MTIERCHDLIGLNINRGKETGIATVFKWANIMNSLVLNDDSSANPSSPPRIWHFVER